MSLSPKAAAAYDHLHAWLVAGKHLAGIVLVVFLGWLGWSAVNSIQNSARVRDEEKKAATTPTVAKDAELKKPLFGFNEKPFKPRVFKPRPGTTGRPVFNDPPSPSPLATPEVPHPEVTTETADHGPVANVYEPATDRERIEVEREFGLDLDKEFLVGQRKEIPRMKWGGRFVNTIPAGGGDVQTHMLANARPAIGFPRTFEVGGGMVFAGSAGGNAPTYATGPSNAVGFTTHAGWEPLRTGSVYWQVNGDADFYSVKLNGSQFHYRVTGLAVWRFEGKD